MRYLHNCICGKVKKLTENISVADPDQESGKQSGSGMNIPDVSESFEKIFWVKNT
jgi:hypothetical protein